MVFRYIEKVGWGTERGMWILYVMWLNKSKQNQSTVELKTQAPVFSLLILDSQLSYNFSCSSNTTRYTTNTTQQLVKIMRKSKWCVYDGTPNTHNDLTQKQWNGLDAILNHTLALWEWTTGCPGLMPLQMKLKAFGGNQLGNAGLALCPNTANIQYIWQNLGLLSKTIMFFWKILAFLQ